ncbi:TerY-C metal binding domain-containing protein [Pseudomonas sp. Irchel 3A7]|uniref:TerY-C metal binding domain-containing protein n=1 Tax=Pseudomonas sp. Irchel 3A7 TaxID=2008913 RepID=UPI000BA4BABD|nr:TerY-C metal binding domain-containing protein [Pseudomonas sp. Irchel 3A7]
MEIIKQQDKPPSLLEKARQELAAFNRKELSVCESGSATGAKMSKPAQAHGERILYCSTVPQASAVLILKLNEKGAEIMDVIVRRKAPAPAHGGAQATRKECDSRALLWGNYKGCPHCGNDALVLCGDCGSLACIAIEADSSVCPACASKGKVVNREINLEFSRSRNGQQGQPQTDQKMLAKPAGQPALPHRSR